MFTGTGNVLCRKCRAQMHLSVIEPVTTGLSKITCECKKCKNIREFEYGHSPCIAMEGLAA